MLSNSSNDRHSHESIELNGRSKFYLKERYGLYSRYMKHRLSKHTNMTKKRLQIQDIELSTFEQKNATQMDGI